MSDFPVRRSESDAQSFLPPWIRHLPYKGRVGDYLGLFALQVLVLGLLCFLGGNSMMIQDADDLQSLGFFLLGTGQLLFLRKKLPIILLKKKLRLFSRQGWYYIGVLCALLIVLLFLLYLFVDTSHLFMVGVSLCAFLLPFTVSNIWESYRDKTAQAEAKRKKIFRAGLLGAASLLLFVGLTSLAGRQTRVPRADPAPVPASLPAAERSVSKTPFDKVGLVLNEYASRLLESDIRFSRLARTSTATNPVGLAKAGYDIKAQEYALGKLLDSLDNKGRAFSSLTAPFRSLLAAHRILSQLQNDKEVQPDSVQSTGLR